MPPTHRAEDLAQLRAIVTELTEAHRTYLDTVARLVGHDTPAASVALPDPAATVEGAGHAPARTTPAAPPAAKSAPQPTPAPTPAPAPAPKVEAPPYRGQMNGHDTPAPRPEAAPSPAPAEASLAPRPGNDTLADQITVIVSEKTGYPTDMLDLDMALESELGVDSIKQVEILAAVRERIPGLPEIAPEQVADLSTIREIASFLSDAATGPTPKAAPQAEPFRLPDRAAGAPEVPAPHVNGAPAAAATGNGHTAPPGTDDLADTLRNLIAEKTGYPTDMLEDDMDLEGELGVDSIKQVEILAALRDARPDLPELSPEQASELRSIREIADFFR